MITSKLAWRNILRNRWRTLLTAGGIAVAVGLMIWMHAYINGFLIMMVEGATAIEHGQIQIHDREYADKAQPRHTLSMSEDTLGALREMEGVRAVSPRVELYGLVGGEERSQVSRILGVVPDAERRATPIEEALVAGRWLAAPKEAGASGSDGKGATGSPVREIVLGKGLADQLKVEVGEELVIFLQATDGSLGNDALEVVGIVETGNTAIDRQTSYVTLDEAKFLGAMGDRQLHEVALWIDDPHRAETLADRIGARGIVETGPDSEMVVRPWQELMPEMSQMIEVTSSAYWIYYLFVYFLAIFGIVNTQRMSAFERRREFGVMLAIGVSPGRIFGMILGETVLLCLVGSVLGIVLGGGISYYFQVEGLNMAAFARQGSGDFTFMGVSFSQLLHFQLTWRAILEPTLVMLAVGLVSGLWPAVVASRIDPPRAIAGR